MGQEKNFKNKSPGYWKQDFRSIQGVFILTLEAKSVANSLLLGSHALFGSGFIKTAIDADSKVCCSYTGFRDRNEIR